jgi:hypothetical protein
MATDYILFMHGVKTPNEQSFRQDAQILFDRIQQSVNNSSINLKPVYLFWGDVSHESTQALLQDLKASSKWSQFWFRELRTEQILPFVGDAALYLSRHVSATIVQKIAEQGLGQMGIKPEDLRTPPRGDRLHLVTHSWGTVILFDVLFAPRWEDEGLEPAIRQRVENIRTGFFGVGNGQEQQFGIPIRSIHTMGSPISLFSLINASGGRSFNLTPKLKELLDSLYALTGKPLPWLNYAHPGDPIAYPLEGVVPLLLRGSEQKVKIQDFITSSNPFIQPFSQSLLPVLFGGDAHSSYWKNKKIAKSIAQVIQNA